MQAISLSSLKTQIAEPEGEKSQQPKGLGMWVLIRPGFRAHVLPAQ